MSSVIVSEIKACLFLSVFHNKSLVNKPLCEAKLQLILVEAN